MSSVSLTVGVGDNGVSGVPLTVGGWEILRRVECHSGSDGRCYQGWENDK